MCEDVEFIEDNKEIIEISDDDSLPVQDDKDIILTCNAADEIAEKNKSSTESSNGHEKTPKHVQQIADNFSCNVNISKEIVIDDTKIPHVNLEDHSAEPANNNISAVDHTENCQVNEPNTFNQHGSLRDKIVESTNNLNSNKPKPKCPHSNATVRNRRRAVRRRRNKMKTVQNCIIGNNHCSTVSQSFQESVNVEIELNVANKTDENENTNSNVPERATCSSSKSSPESIDFSKLKWLKPLNNLSSPPHLQMVIIDRSDPNWRISNDKWLMIEKRLLEALNNELLQTNDPNIGLFDGAKWQRGIKIVGCQNENALNYITKFIFNLDKLWNGAKLDAFPISHITRHEIKVYIPPPTIKTELILSLIKLQNPSICSKYWKVIRERERPNDGGVDIWININDESFTQLRKLGGEIKYGINRIWVKPSS